MNAALGRDRLLAEAAVEAADIVVFDRFPLAWRWTSSRHLMLDPAELERILPLRAARARSAEERWQARWPVAQLFGLADSADVGDRLSTGMLADDVVHNWLRARLPAVATPIFVAWQTDWAVLTDTDLFVRHWPSFCYPSSDDVVVVPPDLAWALSFHHEEALHFLPAKVADRSA